MASSIAGQTRAGDGAANSATPSGGSASRFDEARVEAAVTELLHAIGEDPSRPGLVATPHRVAAAYREFFAGLTIDPRAALADTIPLGEAPSELVLVRDLRFRSICEHHLLPFRGVAHLAYMPSDRIIGLGRLPLVVDAIAARPQLQERMGEEIADAIEQGLDARGVLVILDATHDCVTTRGSRQSASSTVTVAGRGLLTDPAARAEAISLIGATHAE